MGEFIEEASALSRLYSPVQPKALEVILKITNRLNSEKSYWLSQVWWVKCILRYIPPSEGVELTTKTQRTQRSIDPM